MNTSRVHICLVSGQILANLLPILHYQPQHVHLIISDGMQAKGKIFQDLLDERKITWTAHKNAPDTGYEEVLTFARKVISGVSDVTNTIALNVTGGTKPMAMGFMEVFRKLQPNAPVFYTDTFKQRIEFLHPEKFEDLPNIVDAKTYLHANGFKTSSIKSDSTDWRQTAETRREVSFWLAEQCSNTDFQEFIGEINRATGIAKKPGNIQLRQPLKSIPTETGKRALQYLTNKGFLQQLDEKEIKFSSPDILPYLNGDWLEEYAWLILRDKGYEKCYCSVKGDWLGRPPGEGTDNEFDVVVIKDNKLWVIECKTGNISKGDKNKHILDKLDNLRTKAGGIFSKSMLLSVRPLPEHSRNRAESWKIMVLEGANIVNLADSIK